MQKSQLFLEIFKSFVISSAGTVLNRHSDCLPISFVYFFWFLNLWFLVNFMSWDRMNGLIYSVEFVFLGHLMLFLNWWNSLRVQQRREILQNRKAYAEDEEITEKSLNWTFSSFHTKYIYSWKLFNHLSCLASLVLQVDLSSQANTLASSW